MELSNIGFALYSKGDAPGTLDARWTYEDSWSGPGRAIGGRSGARWTTSPGEDMTTVARVTLLIDT